MKHVCDNCGKKWDLADVVFASDLQERMDPGGAIPSGECRDCGALCYPEKKEKKQPYNCRIVDVPVSELQSLLKGVGVELRQKRVRCGNGKCKHNNYGSCVRNEVILSRASADYNHLEQYMVECISFEEKEES